MARKMPKSKTPITPEMMDTAAGIMKSIAHPLRLRILEILERDGEANVTALCDETGASQPVALTLMVIPSAIPKGTAQPSRRQAGANAAQASTQQLVSGPS